MNYYNHPGISQSYLKQLISGPPPYPEVKETPQMLLGTITDMMLSNDESLEEYIIVPEYLQTPSDSELAIINEILSDDEKDFTLNVVRAIANQFDYGKSWKSETVFRKVVEENSEYINFFVKNKGKKLVDAKTYDTASQLAALAVRHPFSSSFFSQGYVTQVERYFPFEAFGKLYDCKARMDYVSVSKDFKLPNGQKFNGKVIMDFKVTTLHPATAIRKFRYDIQGAFYTETTVLKETDNVLFVLLFLNPALKYPQWVLLDKERLNIGKWGANYVKGEWVVGNGDENDEVKGFMYGFKLHDFYTENPNAAPHHLETTKGELKLYGR